MTLGADGDLYVASGGTASIKRYDGRTGTYLGDFVAPGSGGLNHPDTVVFGPDGDLYVSDRFRSRILHYDGKTGGFVGTLVSDGRLGGFLSFAFGPDGSLYASMFNCCGNQRILHFDGATGAFINAFGEGLPGKDAAYSGIAFGTDGLLYANRFQLIPGSQANRVASRRARAGCRPAGT